MRKNVRKISSILIQKIISIYVKGMTARQISETIEDILTIRVGDNESAKYWRSVLKIDFTVRPASAKPRLRPSVPRARTDKPLRQRSTFHWCRTQRECWKSC